jgi:hypothetical protein
MPGSLRCEAMTTGAPNALRMAVVYYSARGNAHGLARAVAGGSGVGKAVRFGGATSRS